MEKSLFLESLSSFALLDSKILAPPDDPDDIFGMGDDFKGDALGKNKIQMDRIRTCIK